MNYNTTITLNAVFSVVAVFLLSFQLHSQAMVKGSGIRYYEGYTLATYSSAIAPDISVGTEFAYFIDVEIVCKWDRVNNIWVPTDNILSQSGVPAHTPSTGDPFSYLDKDTGNLYKWNGAAWELLINAGSTVTRITNLGDTTSLTPITGDEFVVATMDTSGVYSIDRWLLRIGGGGSGGSVTLSTLDTTFTANYTASTDSFVNRLTSITESNDIVITLPTPSASTVPYTYLVNQIDRNGDGMGFTLVQVDGVDYDFYYSGDTLQFVSFTPDKDEGIQFETISLSGSYRWIATKTTGNAITQIATTTQIATSNFETNTFFTIQNTGAEVQVLAAIPADYPVQSIDSRFVFQDANSNPVVIQQEEKNYYNAKHLGLVADWNHTTRTGTDNKAVLVDILNKIDTNATLYLPEGNYGFSTVTSLDFSPYNLTILGAGRGRTNLYFIEGGTPITLTDAKNVTIKDLSVQGYSSSGSVTAFDFIRTFNADSLTIENVRVDSIDMILTSRGPAATPTYSSKSSVLKFINCEVYNSSNSYAFQYSEVIEIIGGVIYNPSGDGIKFNRNTSDWVIRGVSISESADDLIDTYGGGENGLIENCSFMNGELEIKAHAKSGVADNVVINKNNFINSSITSDEGSYSPLTTDLVFDLAADGTITHSLNLPTTDNTFLEIKAYQDGTTTEVTFTESSITANGFDFTLTSGSYPVTVIVNTTITSSTNHPSVYRTYNQVASGTTTLTLDPTVNAVYRELNRGEPTIITYDTTDYSVVTHNDTVSYSYSTWGDTLTLNWPTATPEGRLVVVQVGMDGVKGLEITNNTFLNGQIFQANGAYEGVIKNNTATYTTSMQSIALPYSLSNLEVSNNYIEYVDSVDVASVAAVSMNQTASTNEGVHPPGNYIIKNNTIVNPARGFDIQSGQWNNNTYLIEGNVIINPEDAANLQGVGPVVSTELVDTIQFTGTNRRSYQTNTIVTPSNTFRDKNPLINNLPEPGWTKNSDGTLMYELTATDPTDQDNFINSNTEFQGILDNNDFTAHRFTNTLRTTGGSTVRNYKWTQFNAAINTSQSLDLRGTYWIFYNNGVFSSQDVSIAKVYGNLDRIGSTSGTGSIDTLYGQTIQFYNGSGHTTSKFIAYDIDDSTVDPIDTIIGLRIPDLQNGDQVTAIYQKGADDPNILHGQTTFYNETLILSTLWLDAAKTLGVFTGSGTPEGAITAAIGSTYHRTDGGAATSYYVKESGVGNTGWIAK